MSTIHFADHARQEFSMPSLRLGDLAPDFEQNSSLGPIRFGELPHHRGCRPQAEPYVAVRPYLRITPQPNLQ
jgi:hypothetical protein